MRWELLLCSLSLSLLTLGGCELTQKGGDDSPAPEVREDKIESKKEEKKEEENKPSKAEKDRTAKEREEARQRRAEEKRLADKRKAEEQERLAEDQRLATEERRIADEKRRLADAAADEEKRLAAEKRLAEEQERLATKKAEQGRKEAVRTVSVNGALEGTAVQLKGDYGWITNELAISHKGLGRVDLVVQIQGIKNKAGQVILSEGIDIKLEGGTKSRKKWAGSLAKGELQNLPYRVFLPSDLKSGSYVGSISVKCSAEGVKTSHKNFRVELEVVR